MEMKSHEDILRDCLDHGDDVGPPARNVKIWDMLIKDFKECFDDCSKKIPMGVLKNIMKLLIMLKKEYIKLYGETSCGIAVLDFSFGLVVSALILFHNGEILYLQVQKKKQVESEWKEAVARVEIKTEEDSSKVSRNKHVEIRGSAEPTGYVAISQDDDKFSRSPEEEDRRFCWCCDVRVTEVEKSLCSGCLKARYCSQGCLRADWDIHGEWCDMRREKRKDREEEKDKEMKERARKDIEKDNHVD